MAEQLFEWETPESTGRKKKPEPQMVPRPPGYHAITNSKGVQGFHRTKVEAEHAKYGAVQTLCGIVGRRISGFYPREIPLCDECEAEFAKR